MKKEIVAMFIRKKPWMPLLIIVVGLFLGVLGFYGVDPFVNQINPAENYSPKWDNWISDMNGDVEDCCMVMMTHEQALNSSPDKLYAGFVIYHEGEALYEVITLEELEAYGWDLSSPDNYGALVIIPHEWDGKSIGASLPVAIVQEDWYVQLLEVEEKNGVFEYTVLQEFHR